MARNSTPKDDETKTDAGDQSLADRKAVGTTLPATGTAGAAADAAGADTLAADADLETKGPVGLTVVVKGPVAGRWRIGRHFTSEPVSIPADELTEAQARALAGDPLLMVTFVEAPY